MEIDGTAELISETIRPDPRARRPDGRPVGTPFQRGQIANPRGKSRDRKKLETAFLRDLRKDFEQFGPIAITNCRETNPAAYIGAIVKLLPRELDAQVVVKSHEQWLAELE